MYASIVGRVQSHEEQSAFVVTVAPTIVFMYDEIWMCFDIIFP